MAFVYETGGNEAFMPEVWVAMVKRVVTPEKRKNSKDLKSYEMSFAYIMFNRHWLSFIKTFNQFPTEAIK